MVFPTKWKIDAPGEENGHLKIFKQINPFLFSFWGPNFLVLFFILKNDTLAKLPYCTWQIVSSEKRMKTSMHSVFFSSIISR
jgi:hypothetical protein